MEGSWRKASYSNGGADNCVEVFEALNRFRDSKFREAELGFTPRAVTAFITAVKADRLKG